MIINFTREEISLIRDLIEKYQKKIQNSSDIKQISLTKSVIDKIYETQYNSWG